MRRTSRWLMPLLSLLLFFGAIGVAQAAGWWVTSGRQAVPVGEMTTDDLKGWMTVQQAADGLAVPADDLVELVGAPAGSGVTAATAFKAIEDLVTGFDLTAYRERVKDYLDQRAGTVPTATPAAPTATSSSGPTGTPSEILPTTLPTTTHLPTATPTGTPEEGIRGSMTVREVAQANGIAIDGLLVAAGLPVDLDPDTVLREIHAIVPGFEIQAMRDAVAALSP